MRQRQHWDVKGHEAMEFGFACDNLPDGLVLLDEIYFNEFHRCRYASKHTIREIGFRECQ